jgi:hypothetical protein
MDMKTHFPEDEDIRAILSGYYQTPGVAIPNGDPTGVETEDGHTYVALANGGGMLAVYRFTTHWRRVPWADVPVDVLQALEGNAGPAPAEFRVWDAA